MRQPEPDNPNEQLRQFLQFAVPLMIRDLQYRAAHGEVSEAWLIGTARRGGASLGARGDTLLFSDRKPRTGRQRDDVTRTTQDLVEGIAAAALLAGPEGVTVFGDHYRLSRSSDYANPQCHATSRLDHADDAAPRAGVPPIPGPRPLADVIRDLTDYQPPTRP
ncbi:hypothetical protein [Streptomyces platensis]|uniref:hypothetical protein n=1 Tax=Streptomyces platensis TaxID=58346 RepID=UPI0037A6D061